MPRNMQEERLRWVLPIIRKEIKLCEAKKVCPHSERSLKRWVMACPPITDHTKFDQWLSKIANIKDSTINQILEDVPRKWLVPESYIKKLNKLLCNSKSIFIPLFINQEPFVSFMV